MKNTWRKSYLGFTDGKKPMQKTRMENTLDKLVRYDGEVMYEKEFAFQLLLNGYEPEKQENYSYYSRRLDDYTKPKTRYKMQKEDTFHEVSKTLYDFVGYLIDNEMNTLDKAIEYATIEAEQLEKQAQEQAEKEAKEKEEKRTQNEKEKQERKERHEQKVKEWYENGKQYMNDNTVNALSEAIQVHWNEIEKVTTFKLDDFINHAIESYTGLFGNSEGLKSKVSYTFSDSSNPNNLQTKIDKVFFGQLFGVNEDDKPITVTAKVNAFLENREYKGAKEVETETFYIYMKNEGYTERQGEKRIIDGIVCYIHKENGQYTLTEARSGVAMVREKTKSELVKRAKVLVPKNKEKIENNVQYLIEQNGISPLYEMEEQAQ